MVIDNDIKLDFEDVLIVPRSSSIESRKHVNLFNHYLNFVLPDTIPIIVANMDGIGTFKMARTLIKSGLLTCLHKHYSVKDYIDNSDLFTDNKVFYSLGVSPEDFLKFKEVRNKVPIHNICLDVANAYIPQVKDTIRKIKDINGHCVLMAGNVATAEGVDLLAGYGADIIKIGIGPSRVCRTRHMTGIGVPQFSAILDCVQEARRIGVTICSDGGCKQPGDICKAFGAGAHMVMLGTMIAGVEECEGEWIYKEPPQGSYMVTTESGATWMNQGKLPKNIKLVNNQSPKATFKFYGSASAEAMKRHNKDLSEYKASEGAVLQIPYKGPVENLVKDILGGLRSCCSYVGAESLYNLPERTNFIRVNRSHSEKL